MEEHSESKGNAFVLAFTFLDFLRVLCGEISNPTSQQTRRARFLRLFLLRLLLRLEIPFAGCKEEIRLHLMLLGVEIEIATASRIKCLVRASLFLGRSADRRGDSVLIYPNPVLFVARLFLGCKTLLNDVIHCSASTRAAGLRRK